ncbi:LPXTG cell wall anchor domain-containing protein [Leifsonia naganoensis]|nr:LPXTG cell wall anchor domain-containing protein [Leifsonia naganoensis]
MKNTNYRGVSRSLLRIATREKRERSSMYGNVGGGLGTAGVLAATGVTGNPVFMILGGCVAVSIGVALFARERWLRRIRPS